MKTRVRVLALAAVVAALFAVATAPTAVAQSEDDTAVLVYSRTAGFRHVSIPDGIRTIRELGDEHGFAVEATEDPAAFTDDNLARFDAVVFLNTTGDVVPAEGQAAFERYVRAGGGYVGVHSAADTEYDWDFYGRLLGGAWFLAHPLQQPGVIVTEVGDQPSTAHLPERWQIPLEEFYSFRASPRDEVRVLLSIDESTYQQDPNTTNLPDSPTFPEGQSGVMGDHPMSWCVDVGAGRAWYSALGHESYLYQLPDYRQHLLGGLLTATRLADADCTVAAAAGADDAPPPYPPAPSSDPAPGSPSAPSGSPVSLPATGAGAGAAVAFVLAAPVLWRRRR